MSKCARPGCPTTAKSSCSGCGREQYCGSICQKMDWNAHKPKCPILKKFLNELQPFHVVVRIIDEIRASKKGNDARVLDHLLLYSEHQFGKEVSGIGYRERRDGENISNWKVDIDILQDLNCRLIDFYLQDKSLAK